MRSIPRFPKLLMSVSLVLAAITQACASDVRRAAISASGNADGQSATVPFDLYQGYFMVVHGSVGRLKNLNFFVDTGTTPLSSIRGSRESSIFRAKKPTSIVILGGKVQGEEANLPSLEFGPVQTVQS